MRNMCRVCCKKLNYSLLSATNFRNLQHPDLLQDSLKVGGKTRRFLTRFAAMSQNKSHVLVSRYTVP